MRDDAPPPDSPTRDRELRAGRVIAASREQVFAAFLDPARLARWWGPRGFRNTFAECDPRPGGRWRFVMHGPDGRDFPNESLFAEVDPPDRIVIRHVSAPRFDLEVTLTPEGDRTRVGWVQRFETAEVCEGLRPLIGPKNDENLERLEAEVLAPRG
jgi:uncharacterized protein YndB with AHSA1/START domain